MGKVWQRLFGMVTVPFMTEDDGAGSGAAGLDNDLDLGAGDGSTGDGDPGTGGAGDNNNTDFDDDLDTPVITKRKAAQMVSSRVNEVKKQFGDYGTYHEVAKMIGEIIGTDDPKIIHERIQQLHTNHVAQQSGMTPQGYQSVQQAQRQTQQSIEQFRKEQANKEYEALVANKDYSDAALFKDEIIDMVAGGMPIQRAYWAVAGELKANKKAQAASFEAEQLALNNIQNRGGKAVQGGGSGKPEGKAQIAPEIVEAANRVGMDPEEYAKWMGVNNIEQARALRRQ